MKNNLELTRTDENSGRNVKARINLSFYKN